MCRAPACGWGGLEPTTLARCMLLQLLVKQHNAPLCRLLICLQWHFHGGSFRYGPTPHAKGKIEPEPQFWKNRLPAFFASETIADLAQANPHISDLRPHRRPTAPRFGRPTRSKIQPANPPLQSPQTIRPVLKTIRHAGFLSLIFGRRNSRLSPLSHGLANPKS